MDYKFLSSADRGSLALTKKLSMFFIGFNRQPNAVLSRSSDYQLG